jgi:phospholipid transport system substrate-binding protein
MKTLVILVSWFLMVSQSFAAPRPRDVVQDGTGRVLEALAKYGGSQQARRQEVRRILDQHFDFREMAKRSLGPEWARQQPNKQEEFVRVYSQFMFNVYIDRVEKHTNEKITYEEQEVKGSYATVKAIVHAHDGDEILIVYRLQLVGDEWKAYDVIVEGIDLVNNYRAQFNAILARSSFDGLLKQLQEKNAAWR